MTILKRISRLLLAAVVLFSLFSGPVRSTASAAQTDNSYLNADEVVALISDTYKQIQSRSGRRSFYNRCSTMVNYTSVALGLQTQVYSCNGKEEYDLYKDVAQTDKGFDVRLYGASDYSLGAALNAISENGTKDVYNIIVGWQSGSSYASRYYGHTCFIFAILDGYVYFYESYGLSIGGKYYKEGAPIVCTIDEFTQYYNRWAKFDGAVHLVDPYVEALYADDEPPQISGLTATELSGEGFTLTFQVSDNIGLDEVQVQVRAYGQAEADALTYDCTVTDGTATVQISTEDFDGFVGRYHVTCSALDQAGNTASAVLDEDVDLYVSDLVTGTYRVLSDGADACNAPYDTVNGADTIEYTIDPATKLTIVGEWVNDLGETWLQLEDGTWINADAVIREIQWYEVIEFLNNLLSGSTEDSI